MKKKLLFIAPGYYGFNDVVIDGLKTYTSYEVVSIDPTATYVYKSFGERILNFFLKTFFGKNLKKIKRSSHVNETIKKNMPFDLLIVNRPDVLRKNDLDFAIQSSQRSSCFFWDSLEKIPAQKDFLNSFDKYYSFDPTDCIQYGFNKITNFYFQRFKDKQTIFEVALLMTYDNRIQEAIKIFNYFTNNGIKAKAKIFAYKSTVIKEKLPDNMEIINQIIPFNSAFEYYLDSKAILDLAHPNQSGISFRPFEAIGLEKKLITTAAISNLDIYRSNNIHIIEDVDHIDIPDDFFEKDYDPLPDELKEKYFIKHWVENITN